MFALKCNDFLPINSIVIHSLAVRGRLGPITVWVCNRSSDAQSYDGSLLNTPAEEWTKIHERTYRPSWRAYQALDFQDTPVTLEPGQVKAFYIHSSLRSDESIVYDNERGIFSHQDKGEILQILPGRAHLSDIPFGNINLWGWQGAWRLHREFVGRISFGAVYKLWNPQEHKKFGSKFQNLALLLFACQRRAESPFSMVPDEVIFYILNMCRWDWVNDCASSMLKSRGLFKKQRGVMAKLQIPCLADRETWHQRDLCVIDSSGG